MSIKLPSKTLTAPVSFEEAKKVIANLDKKRVPFAKPRELTTSQRLTQYSGVLSKLDPSKIIRIVPNPTFTLTLRHQEAQMVKAQ